MMSRPDDDWLRAMVAGGPITLRDAWDLLRVMAEELLELRELTRVLALRCGRCGAPPGPRDRARIDADLARPHSLSPAAWYCPLCAPDLELTSSGLAWDVVEVVGASGGGR